MLFIRMFLFLVSLGGTGGTIYAWRELTSSGTLWLKGGVIFPIVASMFFVFGLNPGLWVQAEKGEMTKSVKLTFSICCVIGILNGVLMKVYFSRL